MNIETMYIYGRNPVYESLNAGDNIEKVYLAHNAQGPIIDKIYAAAKRNKIPVTVYDARKFSFLERDYLPKDQKSQGVMALRCLIEEIPLEDFLEGIDLTKNPVVAILDGITDPHNFGAISRSAECAGFAAIIKPLRNSAIVTPTAIKTSSGALENIPVITVGNLVQTLDTLKDAGFWIVGSTMDADHNYYDTNIYDRPIAVVIGSEGEGMHSSVRKNCDYLIKIPMMGKTDSLNASVSAGIIFFEILRQRILGAGV
ncbi:MAG: 23S rRNA (guanosine(2251)-2'-O)-methyltransferase RlmB [bacterium]